MKKLTKKEKENLSVFPHRDREGVRTQLDSRCHQELFQRLLSECGVVICQGGEDFRRRIEGTDQTN